MTSLSLSSTMLLFAHILTTNVFTCAAPMDCSNDAGSSLNQILEQLSQVQRDLNILKGTRTSVKARNSIETQPYIQIRGKSPADRTCIWFLPSVKDCADVYKSGGRISGVYTINPHDGLGDFNVYCDQTTTGGGWTVLQKRLDGSTDFNRTWDDYKHGFGNFIIREFWLGLEKIHRMTRNKTENRLRVEMRANKIKTYYAEYAWFGIGDENDTYRLNLGNITDTTTNDCLRFHNNFSFGTWDKDPANGKCIEKPGGGWWYDTKCAIESNLNGIHPLHGKETAMNNMHWAWLGSRTEPCAPSNTEMKIRPVDFN